jgi:hypothetical protein
MKKVAWSSWILVLTLVVSACGDSEEGAGSGRDTGDDAGGDVGIDTNRDTGIDTGDETPAQVCGDSQVTGTERCDQSATVNGCDPGDTCNACSTCQPGQPDEEDCDNGSDDDGDGDEDCLDDDCTGDPACDVTEEDCDAAGDEDGDGDENCDDDDCVDDPACEVEAPCGNGTVEALLGEVCDGGAGCEADQTCADDCESCLDVALIVVTRPSTAPRCATAAPMSPVVPRTELQRYMRCAGCGDGFFDDASEE